MAKTPLTISGGRFKDFETLKLLHLNMSSAGKLKLSATTTGNLTMKTARSTTYGGNGLIKTTNLGSSGLTHSYMTSLRADGDIF